MSSNFSEIPIRWLLTVDSEMTFFLFHSLAEDVFVLFQKSCDSRKNHCQTGEFHNKFRLKNRYRTRRFVIHAIEQITKQINNQQYIMYVSILLFL